MAYVCSQGENGASRKCKRCDGDACEPCEARITDGVAECAVLPPDMGVVPDAAPPAHDAGPHGDGGPSEDAFMHPDMGAPPPNVCTSECMSHSGAVCCTMCGCEAEVRCDPACSPPYEWDCELGCCFDYEIFECLPQSPH